MEPVTIFEMGPRDGLQNEKAMIATEDKVTLVNLLSDCGFQKIEVTSFVSPKWVPQMADGAEVLAGITRKSNVSYTALTPNMRGFEAAVRAGVDEIAIFASASEGFSQKNINCSIEDSIERFRPVVQSAQVIDLPVRGYVSCVTDCPYEGKIEPSSVLAVTRQLIELGCYEVSLGDTIGHGTPDAITRLLQILVSEIDPSRLAGHFHDTKGHALGNIAVSLDFGIRVFDASVGGLGGCPYAPGAKGNVASGAVVGFLYEMGFETGINADALARAEAFALGLVGREQDVHEV